MFWWFLAGFGTCLVVYFVFMLVLVAMRKKKIRRQVKDLQDNLMKPVNDDTISSTNTTTTYVVNENEKEKNN
jgi:hypothetical protein